MNSSSVLMPTTFLIQKLYRWTILYSLETRARKNMLEKEKKNVVTL